MAYGQTGTGKTYILGRLGEEDTTNRGIMVRAMEDILAEVSPEIDSVLVSYLQVVVRRSRCNHYLSELHKTLLDSCISQFTATRDLNCGLAILRYMVA
ncbi:kinesin-like protein KIN-UB [Gossypium hirsutum]|uniref:Kinesin-like protein KIN-UB n=1 Tax=Gossypium hirsutum TaxID=3635 RepID=A0A1U8JQM1_GOSHI|nr:kinesin-like protein KIN-UB [Gossypium hirsutum]